MPARSRIPPTILHSEPLSHNPYQPIADPLAVILRVPPLVVPNAQSFQQPKYTVSEEELQIFC